MNLLQFAGSIFSEANMFERILLIGGSVFAGILLAYCFFLLYSKFT